MGFQGFTQSPPANDELNQTNPVSISPIAIPGGNHMHTSQIREMTFVNNEDHKQN